MPVPSRKARDGTAATKPPSDVGGRFYRGRPFFGRAAACSIQYQAESPPNSGSSCKLKGARCIRRWEYPSRESPAPRRKSSQEFLPVFSSSENLTIRGGPHATFLKPGR